MKNSFKLVAVAAAGAIAALTFGALLSENPQLHGGHSSHQQHGKSHELQVKMSGFQLSLRHIVDREYHLGMQGADASKHEAFMQSMHRSFMSILSPSQQSEALAEMLKKHPEADMAKLKAASGSPMGTALSQVSAGQKTQLEDMHKEMASHMEGMSEEQLKAIHYAAEGSEAAAHLNALQAKIRGMLTAAQTKEWDAILEKVRREVGQLKSK